MALRHYCFLFCPGGTFPAGFGFGADSGGAGAGAAAGGAGSGAGGAGSFSTAGGLVEAGGVVTAGPAADGGGAAGTAVVGAGLVSDCPGQSATRSRTVIDPKPTSSAATNASGSQTARLPIR
jgi:hypothetical protein